MRTYEPFGGRLFFQPLPVAKGTRLVTVSHTWETEAPFRFSSKTVVVRLPFRGLAVGWWRDSPVESLPEERERDREQMRVEAEFNAYKAVNGSVSRKDWDSARKTISDMGFDPDEEMEMMQMLGVMG